MQTKHQTLCIKGLSKVPKVKRFFCLFVFFVFVVLFLMKCGEVVRITKRTNYSKHFSFTSPDIKIFMQIVNRSVEGESRVGITLFKKTR